MSFPSLEGQPAATRRIFPNRPEPVTSIPLPWDLRDWITNGDLISIVEEETRALCDRGAGRPQPSPNSQPWAGWLAIMAYGYVTQVFSSQEIARRCRSDVSFRLLCGDSIPFPNELSRFRRRNLELMEALLTNLFVRVLRSILHRNLTGTEIGGLLRVRARERLNVAHQLDLIDE